MIEGPSYYPGLSGRRNLAMIADYLGLPAGAVDDALATVGLRGQADKLARHYSLGMKQRLGLAMALLSRPPLMLLDEPTNGLDPEGVVEIRELIVRLARERGTTVVVSSHILSEIERMADSIGIISAGRLRYQGPLAGLQDEDVVELGVERPDVAVAVLRELGVPGVSGASGGPGGLAAPGVPGGLGASWPAGHLGDDRVRIPMLPDAQIGAIVARLVAAGTAVYRVATVRRTLEQAFLQLVEQPQAPVQPQPPAQLQPQSQLRQSQLRPPAHSQTRSVAAGARPNRRAGR